MACVQRLEKDLEDVQDIDKNMGWEEDHEARPGKRIQWNLRSRSKSTNDSSESSVVDEGDKTSSKSKMRKKTEGNKDDEVDKLTEKGVASESNQTDTAVEREEPALTETRREVEMINSMNGIAEVEGTGKKADVCDVAGSEHEIRMVITVDHVSRAVCEGDDHRMNECGVNAGDTDHEQQVEILPARDDFKDVATMGNAQAHSGNVGKTVGEPLLGDDHESNNEVQVAHNEEIGSDMSGVGVLPESHLDKGNVQKRPELVEDISSQNAVEDQEGEAVAESDQNEDASSEMAQEPPIAGLCDAGMRTPQVSHFKACLRKSIQFVDAIFCNPPQGKNCFRNCKKICSRQCSEGIPCRDKLCRNWHDTEAHTERCNNPLCEFTNRIFLREVMHQIADHEMEMRVLQLQWEEKIMDLALVTTGSTKEQCTPDELTALMDEVKQLEQRIADAKEVADSLIDKKRGFLVNLSAIGIMPQDDATDGFPDFETHYR